MSQETQEPSALTPEQQQRTHATLTAAEVLRPRPMRSSVIGTVPVESMGPRMIEVISLANYIVTGEHPAAFERRATEPPLMRLVDLGTGSYTLGKEWADAFAADLTARIVEMDQQIQEGKEDWEIMGDPGAPITHNLLTLVQDEIPGGRSRMPTEANIEGWTDEDRARVANWAACIHMRASDHDDVEVPDVPDVLAIHQDEDPAEDGDFPTQKHPIKDTPQGSANFVDFD